MFHQNVTHRSPLHHSSSPLYLISPSLLLVPVFPEFRMSHPSLTPIFPLRSFSSLSYNLLLPLCPISSFICPEFPLEPPPLLFSTYPALPLALSLLLYFHLFFRVLLFVLCLYFIQHFFNLLSHPLPDPSHHFPRCRINPSLRLPRVFVLRGSHSCLPANPVPPLFRSYSS